MSTYHAQIQSESCCLTTLSVLHRSGTRSGDCIICVAQIRNEEWWLHYLCCTDPERGVVTALSVLHRSGTKSGDCIICVAQIRTEEWWLHCLCRTDPEWRVVIALSVLHRSGMKSGDCIVCVAQIRNEEWWLHCLCCTDPEWRVVIALSVLHRSGMRSSDCCLSTLSVLHRSRNPAVPVTKREEAPEVTTENKNQQDSPGHSPASVTDDTGHWAVANYVTQATTGNEWTVPVLQRGQHAKTNKQNKKSACTELSSRLGLLSVSIPNTNQHAFASQQEG